MENTNEDIITSENDDTDGQKPEIISDDNAVVNDMTALKEKLSEMETKNRQLFERAKKAEGFKLVDGKWVKSQEAKPQEKPEPSVKSGELDYGQKAFLRAEGIKTKEEIDLVQAYIGNTGKSLEEVVENKWFQNELKDLRELKATELATPSSSGRSSSAPKDKDFYLAKYASGTPIT